MGPLHITEYQNKTFGTCAELIAVPEVQACKIDEAVDLILNYKKVVADSVLACMGIPLQLKKSKIVNTNGTIATYASMGNIEPTLLWCIGKWFS